MRRIDDIPDTEIIPLLVERFGFRRASQIVGYCVLWGLSGRVNDLAAYRSQLESNGLSRTSAFDVLKDLRDFRMWVEGEKPRRNEGSVVFPMMAKIARLGALV